MERIALSPVIYRSLPLGLKGGLPIPRVSKKSLSPSTRTCKFKGTLAFRSFLVLKQQSSKIKTKTNNKPPPLPLARKYQRITIYASRKQKWSPGHLSCSQFWNPSRHNLGLSILFFIDEETESQGDYHVEFPRLLLWAELSPPPPCQIHILYWR